MLNGKIIAPFGFIYCDYNFYAMVRKNNENRDVMNIIHWIMTEEKKESEI